MLLKVIHAAAIPAHTITAHPALHFLTGPALSDPMVMRASLSIPDTLFLFVVALVVFGPKRLPEIGKQIGKLVFEFRRASNDFKLQIEEELRVSEQQEKQKKLELQAAAAVDVPRFDTAAEATTLSAPILESGSTESGAAGSNAVGENPAEEKALVIQPPSSGTMVEATPPNRFRAVLEAASDEPQIEAPEVQRLEAGLEQSSPAAATEGATTQHG